MPNVRDSDSSINCHEGSLERASYLPSRYKLASRILTDRFRGATYIIREYNLFSVLDWFWIVKESPATIFQATYKPPLFMVYLAT